jgi:diacylglycerol O-acyltransferase
MSQTLDRMSTLDAEFFYAEHHNVPMHIEVADWIPAPRPSLAELAAGDLRDAVTRPLRQLSEIPGLVPVSVRGADEGGVVTNRVSAVLANLPVGEADPLRRLGLIRQEMDGLKHTHQAVGGELLTGMLGLTLGSAPMWLALGTQAAFRIRQPLVQTVTTNVPGPRRPLYVLGRPLTALHPYVAIGNAVRISVAILSYVDSVSFGVTADYDAALDLDTFTEGIRRGLADLGGGAQG